MSTGLLLVTHPGVGDALVDTAASILGELPLATATLSPRKEETPEATQARGIALTKALATDGGGVLILTDAYGATPGNVAVAIGEQQGSPVVTGLNLPMLLRVMNYPYLALDVLAEKAIEAAQDSILQATPAGTQVEAGKND